MSDTSATLARQIAEGVVAHSRRQFANKCTDIARRLRDLADDIERQAEPKSHSGRMNIHGKAAGDITHAILNTLPTLGLSVLADAASDADYYSGVVNALEPE